MGGRHSICTNGYAGLEKLIEKRPYCGYSFEIMVSVQQEDLCFHCYTGDTAINKTAYGNAIFSKFEINPCCMPPCVRIRFKIVWIKSFLLLTWLTEKAASNNFSSISMFVLITTSIHIYCVKYTLDTHCQLILINR